MSEDNSTLSQTKLFVGGLNWKLRGMDLKNEFSKFGEVTFARVKLEQETNKSKGFGFVEFANPEAAAKAQKAMDGQEIMWRVVKVEFARQDNDKITSNNYEQTSTNERKKQSIEQAML